MDDRAAIFGTALIILAYFLWQVARRRFDPFAPVWLFFIGYLQVYVIQALSYHDWALLVHGQELVNAANLRACWALAWFLAIYHLGVGPALARRFPEPPRAWSPVVTSLLAPPLLAWGLFCSGVMIKGGIQAAGPASPEETLLRSFPFVLMVAAVLLIVTGRSTAVSRPGFLAAGLFTSAFYIVIWMFNGKRSHSLLGVLSLVCALYITRLKRPSWPVLAATLCAGALVVGIAIGWRNNPNYELSFSGFAQYLSEFQVAKVLESLNMEEESSYEYESKETTEYGGYLLMCDTVPDKSSYDYGFCYARIFTTYIPRLIWPSKPLPPGRRQWIDAWIAGSELEREEDFTGPAIGILGATQLNGGVVGTLLVLAAAAVLLRTSYEYFQLYAEYPWVQFFWAITFFNSWFMVVGDDPLTWFYYNWGFTGLPILILLWWIYKRMPV